jgi:hypothetical protein
MGWPTCEVCFPCPGVAEGEQSVTSMTSIFHIDVVRARTGISAELVTLVTRAGTRLGGRIRPGWGDQ